MLGQGVGAQGAEFPQRLTLVTAWVAPELVEDHVCPNPVPVPIQPALPNLALVLGSGCLDWELETLGCWLSRANLACVGLSTLLVCYVGELV